MQNMGIVYGLKGLHAEVDLLTLEPQKKAVGFDHSMQKIIDECIKNVYFIPLNAIYRKINDEKKYIIENTGHENKKITFLKGIIRRFIKNLLVFDLRIINMYNVDRVRIDLNKYDIIISAADPKSTHCMANRLIKQHNYKGRYIQYWGDPMYLDITRDKGLLDGICKFMEKKTLQPASKVVYATPFTLREQKNIYPAMAYKMSYAHQAAVSIVQCTDTTRANRNGKLSMVYCGDYRKETRNILPLYRAVKDLDENVELDIYGTSNLQLTSADNVIIHGQVSREVADKAEQKADILVCICNIKGSQIPGKIYYLTSYNKPIIIITDGDYKEELKSYFNKMKRFIVCDNNEADIVNTIKLINNTRCNIAFKKTKEFDPVFFAEKVIE